MSVGEIRTIYIHPELAYRTNNFDPNCVLEATVELLHFFSDATRSLASSDISDLKFLEVTQEELDQLQLKDYYVLGWKLWDHLRWGHRFFSKEDLITFLKKEPLQKNSHEEINAIHWKIYQERTKNEYTLADLYLKNLSSQSQIKCLIPGTLYCQAKKMRESPINQTLFTAKTAIKDREGKTLCSERVETIHLDHSIEGFKESLPYLIPNEPVTLFIHPKLAYKDVDSPLGDMLLIVDLELLPNDEMNNPT